MVRAVPYNAPAHMCEGCDLLSLQRIVKIARRGVILTMSYSTKKLATKELNENFNVAPLLQIHNFPLYRAIRMSLLCDWLCFTFYTSKYITGLITISQVEFGGLGVCIVL